MKNGIIGHPRANTYIKSYCIFYKVLHNIFFLMSVNADGIKNQLFKDFKYQGTNITYNDAEAQLKSIFQLLKNEIIDFCFPVELQIANNKFKLYATNWAIRIIFDNPITDTSLFHNFVVPLKTIIRMEKEGHKSIKLGKFGVKIYFSSGSHLTFEFPKIEGIRSSFIKRIEYLKKCPLNYTEGEWTPDPAWVRRLSQISHFDIFKNEYCRTYPLYFVIPKNIPLHFINEISHGRSHDRFPIISYFYIPPNSNGNDKVALMRSSQPSTLFKKSKRSYEYQYLASVCGDHGLTIIDCRPKKNAVAYELIGKGYESTKGYKKHIRHVEFHFLGIPHASKIRHLYILMMKELFHRKSSAYKKWGELTMQLLDGSSFVANNIVCKSNAVLIHCSDGWDRTAQICSLSQVLIEPYYRTVKGFIELIQKDWIDMGHLFCIRCGHVKSVDFSQASPIFAQFIDSVAQLMHKYPTEFQFNLKFLEILLSNAYSQLFGDFMGNNYIERLEMKRPTSLFSCFEDENFGLAEKIMNNQYQCSDQVLKMKKDDDYKFFAELLGSPVFFSAEVPLITENPPPIPNFSIYELERISMENRKERKLALKNININDNCNNTENSDNDDDDDVKSNNNRNTDNDTNTTISVNNRNVQLNENESENNSTTDSTSSDNDTDSSKNDND